MRYYSLVLVCPNGTGPLGELVGHYTLIQRPEAKKRRILVGDTVRCPSCKEKVVTQHWDFENAIKVLKQNLQSMPFYASGGPRETKLQREMKWIEATGR